ncbi:hypothetical protein MTO96_039383 [Rhipicephalus appendiculatus]
MLWRIMAMAPHAPVVRVDERNLARKELLELELHVPEELVPLGTSSSGTCFWYELFEVSIQPRVSEDSRLYAHFGVLHKLYSQKAEDDAHI